MPPRVVKKLLQKKKIIKVAGMGRHMHFTHPPAGRVAGVHDFAGLVQVQWSVPAPSDKARESGDGFEALFIHHFRSQTMNYGPIQ